MTYILIILLGMVFIATGNICFNTLLSNWYEYAIATILFTISVILLDGIVAFIIRLLPEKWMNSNKKIFIMSPKEKKLYEWLKVPKWKEKVPELGQFTNFRKNKIEDPKNNEYISKYILEATYGILIHYISCPVSYLIIFLDYHMWDNTSNLWLTIGVPVAFVNSILILLPSFILKYNLPKLKTLYKLNLRRLNKDRISK